MEKFTKLTSSIALLPINDIDTDQIIPARFLKVTDKKGLGKNLFADWRYRSDGTPDPDFALNKPENKNAQVLLVGDNFGCGSSREHAPWALVSYGFRAVISTSFADIFYNNALKNALLPIIVDEEIHKKLFKTRGSSPEVQVSIDLAAQKLQMPGGAETTFPINPFSKNCMLNGMDELGYLLSFSERIEQYEAQRGIAVQN